VESIDLRKQLRHLYNPSAKSPEIVDVPQLPCLMVDGGGAPDSDEFRESVGALYSVAYDLRFWLKRERAIDAPVMPLEGLWWTDGPPLSPAEIMAGDKSNWHWTLFIVVPDVVSAEDVALAKDRAAKKRPSPALAGLRLDRFEEGLTVQVMHVGPYATEAPTIERLHAFARESGLALRGKHHEIYVGDPNRSKPEALKTIIRMPVSR
jgi:hypothetical protein